MTHGEACLPGDGLPTGQLYPNVLRVISEIGGGRWPAPLMSVDDVLAAISRQHRVLLERMATPTAHRHGYAAARPCSLIASPTAATKLSISASVMAVESASEPFELSMNPLLNRRLLKSAMRADSSAEACEER